MAKQVKNNFYSFLIYPLLILMASQAKNNFYSFTDFGLSFEFAGEIRSAT
jgi:hypothetical protein